MESFEDFKARIGSFEKREFSLDDRYFEVSGGLRAKVAEDNSFRPFYGDTVVFDLDNETKDALNEYIDLLYDKAGECFSERLVRETLHMTLHDLNNSPESSEVKNKMLRSEKAVKSLDLPRRQRYINMEMTAVFNMVNTSIVMGLCPAGEEDYIALMRLYTAFDKIVTLPYSLTPHITLAYYAHGGFSGGTAKKLITAVNELNRRGLTIRLDTDRLVYQLFYSMNDYRDVYYPMKGGV